MRTTLKILGLIAIFTLSHCAHCLYVVSAMPAIHSCSVQAYYNPSTGDMTVECDE